MSSKPIAVQLYTVRDLLKTDYETTLRRIAEIGFAGVEPFGFPDTLAEQAALIHELGLEVPSAHIPVPDTPENKEKTLKIAEAYGTKRVVTSIGPEHFASIDAIHATCDSMNQMAAFAAENGLIFGYHNHWWEFEPTAGVIPFALMLERIDPAIVLELDIYWTKVGGANAPAVLQELGKRIELLHVKDGPADKPESNMTAAGEGVIDIPAAVEASQAQWLIVELDRCSTDMMEAVEKSYGYLVDKGFGHGK